MPDYNPAVALQSSVPDPNQSLNTLSKIMGLGQQGLAIQGQKSENITRASQATQAQQDAKERMGLANLMQDPVAAGITNPDGSPTKDARTIMAKVAPTTVDKYYQPIISAAKGRVDLESSAMQLTAAQRDLVNAAYAGPAADPKTTPDDLKSVSANLRDSFAGTPAAEHINKMTGAIDDGIDTRVKGHGPEGAKTYVQGVNRFVTNMSRSSLPNSQISGPGGLATPQGAAVDTGAAIQQGTTAPALAGGGFTAGGAPIAKVTPPTIMAGPGGSIVRVAPGGAGLPTLGGTTSQAAPQPAGGIRRPDGSPKLAQDDAPPMNAPRAVQDAYLQATQQANSHVEQVRHADADYGNNIAIGNTIRHLSKNAKSGPGTETMNNALAAFHTDAGNNAQELGAFLDRQAATIRTQMGLPDTNAGAADAKSVSGNMSYTPKVIQDKNDYTQALTEGLHQYRNGLDRVAGFSGQASPSAVNAFKNAWTQNFDPNVYRGEDAFKRSKEEGLAFVKSLDPAEAKSLAVKRKNLQALASGQLPQ